VLTGSARLTQEAREREERQAAREELNRKKLSLAHRRTAVMAQIENLRVQIRLEEEEFERLAAISRTKGKQIESDRLKMAGSRQVRAAAKRASP
jgi:circadian clock protein KaiC